MAQEAGFECFFLPGSQLSLSSMACRITASSGCAIWSIMRGISRRRHPDPGRRRYRLRQCGERAFRRPGVRARRHRWDADRGPGSAEEIRHRGRPAPDSRSTRPWGRSAAVAARDALDPISDLRALDSLGAERGGFDDALARCVAYVEEGGADFVWLNSVETRDQLKRACKKIPARC